jgi:hypothetical protein
MREILCEVAPADNADEYNMSKVAKLQLAFELVESAILLLKTDWLKTLCSCRVRCKKAGPGKYECSMSAHQTVGHHTWCSSAQPEQQHIQRLGVFLTELVLDALVVGVVRRDQDMIQIGNQDTVQLILQLRGNNSTITWNRDRLRTEMEQKTSRRFTEAVLHCLSNTLRPDTVQQTDLGEFFWNVVVP